MYNILKKSNTCNKYKSKSDAFFFYIEIHIFLLEKAINTFFNLSCH
jgi:hypothetical protein